MKKVYDFIVSVGADCGTSVSLRKNNLQIRSYPFDWLTKPTFDIRIDMILNDFRDFMNFEDLEFMEKDIGVITDTNCDYYKNNCNGFYYLHDFARDIPLKKLFY